MNTGTSTNLDGTKLYNKAMMEQLLARKQEALQKPQQNNAPKVTDSAPVIKWTVEEVDGKLTLNALPISSDVDVSSVQTEGSVKRPDVLNMFGIKIDLKSKVDSFKENYMKNFVLSRSHNLLVSKFAEMKLSFYGTMLSLLGTSCQEIIQMQRKATSNAISQNKILFEENEYTSELLNIIGGPRKYVKTQKTVISEIRKQLITQCERLGLTEYFTKEKVLEVQTEQCKKISSRLLEEKMGIEYQLSMFDHGIC
ncbi:MAG: hypothetical protein NTZ10_03760 [Candidatus Saganbacteria bacterium]|nr:hypothetical protein [Candidatus Saganbacteria bacterium]